MSIPKFTKEMDIIQQLSDLPNSTDGVSAGDLKAKFDEAGLAIKEYLNTALVPALVAGHLPFASTTEIDAQTIQDAIENVQAQVRNASTGTIINGSVTLEKLDPDVVSRSYGGVPVGRGAAPDKDNNPATNYPIGQIWFVPDANGKNSVWMQISEGEWWPMVFDPAPDSDNMFMQYIKGQGKVWTDKEKAIANLGSLRIETGTYSGTGAPVSVTLPVTPKLLVIHSEEGPMEDDDYSYWDNPVTLANGAMAASPHLQGQSVKLAGNMLTFYVKDYEFAEKTEYCNRAGVTYTWTAIY